MTSLVLAEKIRKALDHLHSSYLKDNEYDEGDPIFYRINYRLEEIFGLQREEALHLHEEYHAKRPRRVSQAFCETCNNVVQTIPIIYGVQENDMVRMKLAELEGRLIIGDIRDVVQGSKVAMFGCKSCKSPLPKCGVF